MPPIFAEFLRLPRAVCKGSDYFGGGRKDKGAFEGGGDIRLLAPPDLWARQRESGKTAAALFAEFGVGLTRAGGARVDGWLAVKEFLKVRTAPTGEKTAKLRIFSCCVNLIRCLPTLMCDEKNPNDCAIEPHEITHAPDALRGFCSFWVSGARQAERKMKVNFEFERPKKEPLGAGERVKTI